MQELGDDYHVLKCTEALDNDKYLYIVMPKACEDGRTLKDVILWMEEGLDPSRARRLSASTRCRPVTLFVHLQCTS
jgi:hypothetical protein